MRPSSCGWAPASTRRARPRPSAASVTTREPRSWRRISVPPPRSCWRDWRLADGPRWPASITSTGVTSGWKPSWRASARASNGEHERAAHAGAPQRPAPRRRAGPAARHRRGWDRRRLPSADLHRSGPRAPLAVPQAGRRSRLRDVRRRRPRHRRQGHPARAGAGRLRAARPRLRSLPARRRRAARVVGTRRPRQVVVGPRRHEVRADDGAVLLRARHPGGDRASGRIDRAGATGRAGRAHRRPRPDGRDAAGQRSGGGRGDRALDRAVDRQPRVHEDRVRRDHELHRSIGKTNTAPTTSSRPPTARADLTAPVTMIRTLDARQLGADEVVKRLARPPAAVDPSIQRAVDEILADVRARGDAAVLECTERFDGHAVPSVSALAIAPVEWEAAERGLPGDVKTALAYAAERIERYHAAALPKSWRITDEHGSVLGQEIRPLERVAIYIPGGRAVYPSTVLMTAVPARVAGVRDIVLVTPPGRDGRVDPTVLAAAHLAGVTEGWKIGGAQAIGALAYGTATIRRVDKIVGPGNVYVALAKSRVFGDVGIDMVAGPSEVVVVADQMADPVWIAADLLAQAEHDPMARALLITDDARLTERVQAALTEQLDRLPRRAIAAEALATNGALVRVQSLDDA